jgi:hypothetical protein
MWHIAPTGRHECTVRTSMINCRALLGYDNRDIQCMDAADSDSDSESTGIWAMFESGRVIGCELYGDGRVSDAAGPMIRYNCNITTPTRIRLRIIRPVNPAGGYASTPNRDVLQDNECRNE